MTATIDRISRRSFYYAKQAPDRWMLMIGGMEALVQPDRLRNRILLWVEEEVRADALPYKAGRILEAILYRGELPRGDVPELLSVSDRHARRVVSALIKRGVVVSESTRAPLRLAFTAKLAPRWMPGLFPEQP